MAKLFKHLMLISMMTISLSHAENRPTPSQEIVDISKIYYASMTYIFSNQKLINATHFEKEELFGDKFINNLKVEYSKKYNTDIFPDKNSRLVKALLEAMVEVMDDNKTLLLDEDITFKGFIPAVFAFQISEKYAKKGLGVRLKFTNERQRIRNKFNSPDSWETNAIKLIKEFKLKEYYVDNGKYKDVRAQRLMIPVNMSQMCLTCHGTPKDNPINFNKPIKDWTSIDKTGFTMENWLLSDFGGAISVTLFKLEELGESY